MEQSPSWEASSHLASEEMTPVVPYPEPNASSQHPPTLFP